jgi:hypothetical protein
MSDWQKPGAGLIRPRHDIRVTSGVKLTRQASAQGMADAFAAAIRHRYQRRQVFLPTLERVFGRTRPVVTVRPAYHRAQTLWAPRLMLTVQNWQHFLMPYMARREWVQLIRQSSSRIVEPIYTERLVQRLVIRVERIEAAFTAGAQVASSGSSQIDSAGRDKGKALRTPVPAAPPIARAVRRSTGRAAAPEAASAVSDRRPAPFTSGFQDAGNAQRGLSREPVDINRLTDQIIQTIDRRIIAQRERLGRI